MSETEVKETYHRDCEPHSAENCDINEHHNLEPGADDCGHYVNSGPGTVAGTGTNVYAEDYGKKAIVAGASKPSSANDDQDATNGPGVQ